MNTITKTIRDPENTWLFSDPHFDHANIIQYCTRPFTHIGDMNFELLKNYKKCVNSKSLVFFLGDMAFGRQSRTPKFWVEQLYPVKEFIYIKGSHDHGIRPTNTTDCHMVVTLIITTLENPYIHLVHDHEVLGATDDWVIHGHTHNNTPFFDRVHKRVNVSCDVTGFAPVQLSTILKLIADEVVNTRQFLI